MIKFRVFNKRTHEIEIRPIIVIQEDSIVVSSRENDLIDDYVLMQSTGLTDKNGKEIFEGDIIRVIYGNEQGETLMHGNYVMKNPFEYELVESMWLIHSHEIEVIGNIHQHPHLLETKGEN